jgi:uncharacterized protein YdeI (YjbR/CyaY-like superfamily)
VTTLGSSKRPAVKVTIKGYTYRSTISTMDRKFMVGVSAQVREAAGVAGGDTVEVDIELDTAPREVKVPEDFARALDGDPSARRLFDGLSYSRKLRLVGPISDAKTDETRQRRFGMALAALRDGTA